MEVVKEALSLMGTEAYKAKYEATTSNCNRIEYNSEKSLQIISEKTAAVV